MMMRITGTGSALPRETVDNNQIAEWVETSDEWIRELSLIHISEPHET